MQTRNLSSMYTAGKAVKAYAIYQEKGASYANIPSSRRVMIKEKKIESTPCPD